MLYPPAPTTTVSLSGWDYATPNRRRCLRYIESSAAIFTLDIQARCLVDETGLATLRQAVVMLP